MFDFIKNYSLNKYLAAHAYQRERRVVSLKQAQSVGMVCEITDEDSYKLYFSIFSKLQEMCSKVQMLGYIDDKAVPFYCLEQLAADYFCKKNINWYGKPEMVQIDDFVNADFDMLIDFSQRSLAPVKYILTLTHAKFLVGGNAEHREYYDLLIDGGVESGKKLLENIYLYTQKLTGE